MEFLPFGHTTWVVGVSFVVALVAGFTGLSLTKAMSTKSLQQRKIAVALASLALGGGIWSMHFVAMLGLKLPIAFYYDAAITLASALIAVLIVAIALGILHFVERTPRTIVLAGAIIGVGILVMHYVGMAGLQLCVAVYSPVGIVLSSVVAILLCILAIYAAYNKRNDRSILIGTLCFGGAVFAVHFLAMAGTNFVATQQITEFGPTISNEAMAIGVILSSFVIFGAFLWVGSTFLTPKDGAPQPEAQARPEISTIPCESDGKRVFVRADDVVFIRADGHYTQVYTDKERLFCVWPITESFKRLLETGFMQVHRSYIVNPVKITRFERAKDKGSLFFANDTLPPVPVSRSKVKEVQQLLAK